MPNLIAYMALLLLLPVTAVVFSTLRPSLAVAGVLIFSVLFLPERVAFDAPAIPPLTKLSLSSLCVLVGVLATTPKSLSRAQLGSGLDWLGVLAMLGLLGTIFTNRDTQVYGSTVLPGLTAYDVISEGIDLWLGFLIPYFLGKVVYRTSRDIFDLFLVLAVAGIVYVPFILIELRLSPQCHNWVYGFAQHSFAQTIRAGGYRPMVFMAHGLALAMLVFTAVTSAAALSRAKQKIFNIGAKGWSVLLFVVLVVIKSMGGLIYGLVAVPLALVGSPRRQTLVASVLGVVVLIFPITRTTGSFPTEAILGYAASMSEERMSSLKFRFDNEDILLARANERITFGWGGFGRNRIYNEEGRDISTTDGAWILVVGIYGAVGYVARFGLLVCPIFVAGFALRRIQGRKEQALLGTLAMIVAMDAIDLLPNGLFSHIPVFLAGCLAGLSGGLPNERRVGHPGRPRLPGQGDRMVSRERAA